MSDRACRLCEDSPSSSVLLEGRTVWRVECQGCGSYDVTGQGQAFLGALSPEDRARLSRVTRAATDVGEIVELSADNALWLLDTSETQIRTRKRRAAPGALMPGDRATVTGVRQRYGEVVRIIHSGGLSLNEGDVAATSADGEMCFFRTDQLTKLE